MRHLKAFQPDLFFAFRLAIRQLRHEKVRFLTAICGVVFACILVFMQIGFKNALFESATLLQRTMSGDLYIEDKQSEALWRLVSFPRQDLYRALSVDGIESVSTLYSGQAPWRNPVTGVYRTALVLGLDPHDTVYSLNGLAENSDLLKMQDSVLFDELSRPEFGPVKELLAEKGTFPVEVAGHRFDVVGTFKMGITFSADGNLIVNDSTFFKMFPMKSQSGVDVGIIKIKEGYEVEDIRQKLKKILPSDLRIMTKPEYIESEKAYWDDITPIGYIFNFGVVMGLFVGFVIVYQVLFNDITNHLHEYATLKAMGYDNTYFIKVVVCASVILIVTGFIPGWVICNALYKVVENSTFIDMNLSPQKVINTFFLISLMCFASALLAVRKLKSADPVDVFQ